MGIHSSAAPSSLHCYKKTIKVSGIREHLHSPVAFEYLGSVLQERRDFLKDGGKEKRGETQRILWGANKVLQKNVILVEDLVTFPENESSSLCQRIKNNPQES